MSMNTYVKIKSPATLANFGPGFDVFGIALEKPYDIVELEVSSGPSTITTKNYNLPTNIHKNVASYAALKLFEKNGKNTSFSMTLEKGIRPASGMGSSGASSVGGAYAAAALCGTVNDKDVIMAAAEGERISSGNAHADNVVPCYMGGFTSIVSIDPLNVINIFPEGLNIVVVLPDIKVSTKKARAILPDKVPMADAISNVAMASCVVHSLMKKDYKALGIALEDRLSIPYRKTLVTGYDDARKAALDSGAMAFSLGGSGPAVFAIVDNNKKEVADAIGDAFADKSIGCTKYMTKIGDGAQILALE